MTLEDKVIIKPTIDDSWSAEVALVSRPYKLRNRKCSTLFADLGLTSQSDFTTESF